MKKIAILSFGIFSLIGCGNSASQSVAVQNSNIAVVNRSQPQTVAAHSTEKSLPPTPANSASGANKPNSASTESPMARAIDVSAQTAKIEAAEKEYKAKPSDAKAKENLAAARFERAFMLTEAAQYRAALGDFRKGLKLAPNDEDAKKMHDEILQIFASLKREPPKEGEEPQPMPFEK
ncbi:MAG TPA: hypothetical protein VF556_01025 [Pyrinomonadaceae bacterium]|jgi:tetratricopeptide (TPR) repeat protein